MLVTLPFLEFVDKRNQTRLTSEVAGGVTNFGLWMNAISDSSAIADGRVSGTIYYDEIIAVASDKTEASFETSEEISVDEMTIETLKKAIADTEAFVKKEYTKKVGVLSKLRENMQKRLYKIKQQTSTNSGKLGYLCKMQQKI